MIAPRKFRTHEARKKARVRAAVRVGVYVFLSSCLVTILVVVLRGDTFRVSDIVVDGVERLSAEEIVERVRAGMDHQVLGFIPGDSTLVLDVGEVMDDLRGAFPRIEQVSVARTGLRGISVNVRERQPQALWCGDVVPPSFEQVSSNEFGLCYLMDRSAFMYAEREEGLDSLDRYYGSLEKADPIGQYLLSEQEFVELGALRRKLKESDLEVGSLLLVDERDMELYLAQRPVRVIVPRSLPTDTVVDRLVAAVTSDAFDETRPVEYVDMRFETRVYVKYVDPLIEDGAQIDATSTEPSINESVPDGVAEDAEGREGVSADTAPDLEE